jgi:hypothetical protein
VLATGLVVVIDGDLVELLDATLVIDTEAIVEVELEPLDGHVCTGPPGTTYDLPLLSAWL